MRGEGDDETGKDEEEIYTQIAVGQYRPRTHVANEVVNGLLGMVQQNPDRREAAHGLQPFHLAVGGVGCIHANDVCSVDSVPSTMKFGCPTE